jgi:hypothetical protein
MVRCRQPEGLKRARTSLKIEPERYIIAGRPALQLDLQPLCLSPEGKDPADKSQ